MFPEISTSFVKKSEYNENNLGIRLVILEYNSFFYSTYYRHDSKYKYNMASVVGSSF